MENSIFRISTSFLVLFLLASCVQVQLVSTHDEEIYNGIHEYKALLNKHVKDMTVLNGSYEGSFEANQVKYNELEVKIDLLVDRASLRSTGLGCFLPSAVSKKLRRHMRDSLPVELVSAQVSDDSNIHGFSEKMLSNT